MQQVSAINGGLRTGLVSMTPSDLFEKTGNSKRLNDLPPAGSGKLEWIQ
jgi:hypothetical protein